MINKNNYNSYCIINPDEKPILLDFQYNYSIVKKCSQTIIKTF